MTDKPKTAISWQERFSQVALVLFGISSIIFFIVSTMIAVEDNSTASNFDDIPVRIDPATGAEYIDAQDLIVEMEHLEQRSSDSIDTAQVILSFLEGATVLVGLSIGAAALYGFGQIKETKQELEKKLEEINKSEDALENQAEDFLKFQRDFQDLYGRFQLEFERVENILQELKDFTKIKDGFEKQIENAILLIQADQEFRIRNYVEAAGFAQKVLDNNPQSDLALYMMGWLQVHHLGELDKGIENLRVLNQIRGEKEWATAKASYGIALRRKGRKLVQMTSPKDIDKGGDLLNQALLELKRSLEMDPNLMDFNAESFWGPVGGIYRDLGNYEAAVKAYRKALKITPMSSYPQGNLSALRLRLAHQETDPAKKEKLYAQALRDFNETVRLASLELHQNPSDYYLLMDLAMAKMMMSYQNVAHFEDAFNDIKLALDKFVSKQALETSYEAGWKFLLDSCPNTPEWQKVRAGLSRAMEMMQETMNRDVDSLYIPNEEDDD